VTGHFMSSEFQIRLADMRVANTVISRGDVQRDTRLTLVRALEKIFPVFLFLLAFLPRALHLVARSTTWHKRAIVFIQAILNGDWGLTMQAPHPGVATMWLSGIAYQIGKAFDPDYDNLPLQQQMAVELIPLVIVIALAIVLAYFLLARIFDRLVAAVIALLLALDPYHITNSKTLHVDGLMAVFMLLSALFIFLYMTPVGLQRRRYLLLSGFFAGLALLSKTPALFMLPFLLLSLGAWKLTEVLASGRARTKLSDWRYWTKTAGELGIAILLWSLGMVATFAILWPSMWVQPESSIGFSLLETLRYSASPHGKPLFFLGQAKFGDPGPLFYPTYMLIRSTAVTLIFFIVGLVTIFSRRIDRYKRLVLLLSLAFVIFFTLEMTLGMKKQARYILPALQFVILIAGFGAVYFFRWLLRGRQPLLYLSLIMVVAIQFAIVIPRHPYYGTHYNLLLGSSRGVLESGIVAGQEQGEGLDIAAEYLNSLPLAKLSVTASQIYKAFTRYFDGRGVAMTDDNVDYLVFARNYVVRGVDAENGLWEKYRTREPKLVVEFDGVPYVWVYKTGPVIDESSYAQPLNAAFGQNIRLLGYDLEPGEVRPGETIELTLYWEAQEKPADDYTVFTHLLDPSEELQGQTDSQPQGGMYPTYLWDEGERIQDTYTLNVTPDAPPGDYEIALGMYTLATMERLPIVDQQGLPAANDSLIIPGPTILSSQRDSE
jgi:4-amino-4-deoxy-L-arabinose transferase-like glycosyltransferase